MLTRCQICHEKRKYLCTDHDHKTGRARGTLCNKCNTGLAFFHENPLDLLHAALALDRGYTVTGGGYFPTPAICSRAAVYLESADLGYDYDE